MTAEEAKKLTKARSFEDIIKDIENAAKRGDCKIAINPFVFFPDEHKLKIMSLGYKVSGFKDNLGLEAFLIEW